METQELQSIGSMVKNMPFFEVVSVDSVNCEAHGEFEQRTYGSGRVSKCPKCLDELDAKRKAEDEAERERAERAAEIAFAVEQLASGLDALSSGEIGFRLSDPFAPSLDPLRTSFNAAVRPAIPPPITQTSA